LNSPNDIIVARNGDIWFTDPIFGRVEYYGVPREPELPFRGVYRVGSNGAVVLLVDDFDQPNGLCFSLDGTQLYVNDTARNHIRIFRIDPDGSLAGGDVFAETTGEGEGGADGMKLDRAGNVYCCGPGGVHVFDPAGVCLGVIRTPEVAANFCFGGDDLRTIFVTASSSLYRRRVEIAGHPLF
jgi:gluconolactonase